MRFDNWEMSVKRTYEFAPSAPPPMTWEDYEAASSSRYLALLDDTSTTEADLQAFLEQNPSFVPGSRGPSGTGHVPFLGSLFTQPQLTGLGWYVPDFMWVATDSISWYPTLIEIESPSKTVFKRTQNEPTAVFSQARNQLAEWDTWFGNPANQGIFVESMTIPDLIHRRRMSLRRYLLYGRRAEFECDRQREKLRASLMGQHEILMSYDRLRPDRNCWKFITVRRRASGVNECVAVPPTLQLGPNNADSLASVEGVDKAIHFNDLISNERKEFLVERLAYWRDWAARDDKGVIGGDKSWE